MTKERTPKGGWEAPGPLPEQSWAEYEAGLPKRGRKLWSEIFAEEIAELKHRQGVNTPTRKR